MQIMIFIIIFFQYAYCQNHGKFSHYANFLPRERSNSLIDNFRVKDFSDYRSTDSQVFGMRENFLSETTPFPASINHEFNDRSMNEVNYDINVFVGEPHNDQKVLYSTMAMYNRLNDLDMIPKYVLYKPSVYFTNSVSHSYTNWFPFQTIMTSSPCISSSEVNCIPPLENTDPKLRRPKKLKNFNNPPLKNHWKELSQNVTNSTDSTLNIQFNNLSTELVNQLTHKISSEILRNLNNNANQHRNNYEICKEKYHELLKEDVKTTMETYHRKIKNDIGKLIEDNHHTEQQSIEKQFEKIKYEILKDQILEKDVNKKDTSDRPIEKSTLNVTESEQEFLGNITNDRVTNNKVMKSGTGKTYKRRKEDREYLEQIKNNILNGRQKQ